MSVFYVVVYQNRCTLVAMKCLPGNSVYGMC